MSFNFRYQQFTDFKSSKNKGECRGVIFSTEGKKNNKVFFKYYPGLFQLSEMPDKTSK